MTIESPEGATEKSEGIGVAVYDLADARFRLHENEGKIHAEELGKKYAYVTFFLLPPLLAVVAFLNFFNPPRTPLLWINVGVAALSLASLSWSAWEILRRNRRIKSLWIDRRKLRDAEKNAKIRLSVGGSVQTLWNYHSDIAAEIDDYRAGARRYRTRHNYFQTFIIIFSLLVTGVTTASAQFEGLEWVAAFLSFLVAAATGIIGYFKFRERGVNMQRAADDLEYEYNSSELGINSYRNPDDGSITDEVIIKRLKDFAERAEVIKSEQRKREQQMEQGPEARSSGGSEGGSS
ncbi:SLATT domain-containing protein [Nocardiopsis sp. FIRDI 009]|uniref:SLATT domain-containing protein n=1 Tax=Nocardiopsis sp. FIRDI 009 TaxID=714197 RepID=UPI000E250E41|nr:DUF4231 domain-containing protein [Nocardiopsis sp. FIRDI 009]